MSCMHECLVINRCRYYARAMATTAVSVLTLWLLADAFVLDGELLITWDDIVKG